jgi:hypothetical protein
LAEIFQRSRELTRPEVGKRIWPIAEGYISCGDGFADRAIASHQAPASSTPATATRASSRPSSSPAASRFAARPSFRRGAPGMCASTTSLIHRCRAVPMMRRCSSPDGPVVVQHTRLDSRRAEIALMTTVGVRRGMKEFI